ncbi:MAG: methyltransferase domain-containing protein [Firmicutes bacterium]|jgi:ubiquinone/menaquinone biosynthesis C-methylase UbiE|nr:methyltransferase domain-containing protein [Bacillota bacterium]MCL5063960.1 methyltransferase domain-containing protein [Bacillota bacterium]
MEEERHAHHHHSGGWTREQLANLERPDRETIMPKGPVLNALQVQPGHRVADVGAGLGYFTFPMAIAVGNSGRVLAVDPSVDACEEMSKRVEDDRLDHVEVIQRPAENTTVATESVDRILWHTMYHDVQDLDASIGEMMRILKPGGRWVVVDWVKDDTKMGPPLSVRVSPDEAAEAIEQRGLKVVERFSPGPVTWGLVVEKS